MPAIVAQYLAGAGSELMSRSEQRHHVTIFFSSPEECTK